jgi:hypothetical protein
MSRLVRPAAVIAFAFVALTSPTEARTAPETTITAGPIGRTGDSSPSFAFASSDLDATFECSLDGSGFSPCTSPKAYAGVTESPHTFAVRSVNAAGEADPTPAERSFVADASVDATVSAARDQVQGGAHIRVAVRIRTNERLRAAAAGRIDLKQSAFDLRSEHEHVDAGRTVVRLRPVADGAGPITKALVRGEAVKAHVHIALVDAVGNQLKVPVAVSLSAGGSRAGGKRASPRHAPRTPNCRV